MTTLVCCWTRRRRYRHRHKGVDHGDERKATFTLKQTKFPDPSHLDNKVSHTEEFDDRYSRIPDQPPQEKNGLTSHEKNGHGTNNGGEYDHLTEEEEAGDSGYALLEDPSQSAAAEGTACKHVKEDDEYDYAQPFFEPSSEEKELVCQISDLKVPTIPSNCVTLLDPLGSGQFGMVHKGVWVNKKDGKEVHTEVAVKTMREGATEEDKVKFLQEAAIMGQFNKVSILGIHGIVMEGDTLSLVIDLMDSDLKTHLSSLKQSLENKEIEMGMLKQLLISFTRQVAVSVSYMTIKGYVHRDLAARNILVSKDGICKIADFGLSRELHHESYYKSHGGKIPVKWTAPEALLYRRYSHASDVWSYGCVLYEIWSLGEKPFSHLNNAQTIEAVTHGYRLPPPPGCPRAIYNIMMDCWNPEHESRVLPCDILIELQQPDFVLLKWDEGETSLYSEESRTLGTSLETGHCLHMDLQRRYIPDNSG